MRGKSTRMAAILLSGRGAYWRRGDGSPDGIGETARGGTAERPQGGGGGEEEEDDRAAAEENANRARQAGGEGREAKASGAALEGLRHQPLLLVDESPAP